MKTYDLHSFRKSGKYYFANQISPTISTEGSSSINTIYYNPFYCSQTEHFNRIAVNVYTAGTSGSKARLGIYSSGVDSKWIYPQSLILDAGEVSVDSTGLKEISIDVTLQGGYLYWLAIVLSGTCTLRAVQYAGGETFLGVDLANSRYYTQAYESYTYGPLPSTTGSTYKGAKYSTVALKRV